MSIDALFYFRMPIVAAFTLFMHAGLMGQNHLNHESDAIIEISIGIAEESGYDQNPVLGELKYGRFAVGFSVLEMWDSTRMMPDGKARAVQIGVWYPAEVSKDQMIYRDYIALSSNEIDHHAVTDAERQAAVQSFKEFGLSVGTPEKAMDQWLSTKMVAGFNARQKDGDFPMVIVAQGNFQAAGDQAFLCEYLASHGYIVATSPSPTRIIGPMKSNNDVFPMAMDQKKDMDIVLGTVKSEFHDDAKNIAVVAHSFGARSALIFINQHPDVKAFISLDGGIGNAIGKEWIEQFTEFKPESIQTPVLHFYQRLDSNMVVPDFELLKKLKGTGSALILVKNMHHYYFSSVGFMAGYIRDFSKSFDKDLSLKCQSYAYYTLEFLNRHVVNKNDEAPGGWGPSKFSELIALQELK